MKNKDSVQDLVEKELLDYEKLKPAPPFNEIYSYWNGGKTLEHKVREIFWLKLKNPAFL